MTVTAIERRRAAPAEPQLQVTVHGVQEPSAPRRRTLPRFFIGALTGLALGVGLGLAAFALIQATEANVRASIVVGAELPVVPPTTDGQYAARVLAQAMNPNLTYAEPEVAAHFTPRPPIVEDTTVLAPVERDLQENPGLIFGVLAGLTAASWGLLMWGLSSVSPKHSEAAGVK